MAPSVDQNLNRDKNILITSFDPIIVKIGDFGSATTTPASVCSPLTLILLSRVHDFNRVLAVARSSVHPKLFAGDHMVGVWISGAWEVLHS